EDADVLKRLVKLFGFVLAIVIVLACGLLAYLFLALPKSSPLTDLRVEATPARIERGRYLARHVAACMDCHSPRDWNQFSAPVAAGQEGGGGEVFGHAFGVPGEFPARNLTPTHLQTWTDAEVVRAFTEGVSKDGHSMFPIMDYPAYGQWPREDIYS